MSLGGDPHGRGDSFVPENRLELSSEVAQANLAKDLVDQLERAMIEPHLRCVFLPRHMTIGVIHDAQRLFEIAHPGWWADLLVKGQSEPVLLVRPRS